MTSDLRTDGSFITFHSARFEAGAEPKKGEDENVPPGATTWVNGTDAVYPATGIPERRKTQRYWFAVWQGEADADRFLSAPSKHVPSLMRAADVRGLKLAPYLHRGAQIAPFAVHKSKPGREEPIVVVTTIGQYSREEDILAAGQRANIARNGLLHADGMLHEMLLVPYPPHATDLFTITVWRDEGAVQRWAYRSESHREAMDFYSSTSEKPRLSFTRFLIKTSIGNWGGNIPAINAG